LGRRNYTTIILFSWDTEWQDIEHGVPDIEAVEMASVEVIVFVLSMKWRGKV
jgi:hypothetical protein